MRGGGRPTRGDRSAVTGFAAAVFLLTALAAVPVSAAPSPIVQWKLSTVSLALGATDYVMDLAVNDAGLIAAVGKRTATGDAGISCISPDGAVLWTAVWNAMPSSVSVDPAGNVYVTGANGPNALTRKYKPSGAMDWEITRAGGSWSAVSARYGAVFVGGSTPSGWHEVTRLDPAAGAVIWTRSFYGSTDHVHSLAADAGGNIYARTNVYALAYSSVGALLWDTMLVTVSGVSTRIRQRDGKVYAQDEWYSSPVSRAETKALSAANGSLLQTCFFGAREFDVLEDASFVGSGLSPSAVGCLPISEEFPSGETARWTLSGFTYPYYGYQLWGAITCGPRGVVYAAGTLDSGILALLDPFSHHPPAKSRMAIRNNVIRIRNRTVASVVFGEGNDGITLDNLGHAGEVSIEVYDASGNSLGILGNVTLSADNRGVYYFDGTIGGRPLRTGVYWIVVRNAVVDRQPIVVINE